ncbi:MAG: hypothetical protein WEA36_10740 [Balneolaceae bacterium]
MDQLKNDPREFHVIRQAQKAPQTLVRPIFASLSFSLFISLVIKLTGEKTEIIMQVLSSLMWLGVIIGSIFGITFFYDSLMMAESAPQQAAGAAIAVASAVIPYCIARAIDEIGRPATNGSANN